MSKIERLTKKQEEKLAEYRDMGVKLGRCTDRIDRQKAVEYGKRLMSFLKREYVATIIMDGPIHSWFAVCLLSHGKVGAQVRDQVWDQVWAQVGAQVGAQVRDQVLDQVWAQVGAQVGAQVRDQVLDQVGDQVGAQVWDQVLAQVRDQVGAQVLDQVLDQVWDQVWAQVGAQVRDQVRDQVWDQVKNFIWPWLDGQFLSNFVAWAGYYREIVGINLREYNIISDQCEFGLVYPLDKFVVICERPTKISRNQNGLHCDGGPSVEYADGTKCWSLNGVSVPRWLAGSKVESIECSEFAKIKNVEIRREFLRKVGVERLCAKLGSRVINKRGSYELHMVPLGDRVGEWPYLKMLNPSINVWHMEAVGKDCKTVQQAINWRAQRMGVDSWNPSVLT